MMTALRCMRAHDRAMCRIKRDQKFQTHGCNIQGRQAVSEHSSKNLLTAASSLTSLPHKLLLLSHPKCGGKLKIIQRRKGGLGDDWHIQTSSSVRDEARARRLLISWDGTGFIPGDKRGMGLATLVLVLPPLSSHRPLQTQ